MRIYPIGLLLTLQKKKNEMRNCMFCECLINQTAEMELFYI